MAKLTIKKGRQEICPTCAMPAERGHMDGNVCKFALQRARSMRKISVTAY